MEIAHYFDGTSGIRQTLLLWDGELIKLSLNIRLELNKYTIYLLVSIAKTDKHNLANYYKHLC